MDTIEQSNDDSNSTKCTNSAAESGVPEVPIGSLSDLIDENAALFETNNASEVSIDNEFVTNHAKPAESDDGVDLLGVQANNAVAVEITISEPTNLVTEVASDDTSVALQLSDLDDIQLLENALSESMTAANDIDAKVDTSSNNTNLLSADNITSTNLDAIEQPARLEDVVILSDDDDDVVNTKSAHIVCEKEKTDTNETEETLENIKQRNDDDDNDDDIIMLSDSPKRNLEEPDNPITKKVRSDDGSDDKATPKGIFKSTSV